jgi:ADP-heptose:LPS heptosyltransferase
MLFKTDCRHFLPDRPCAPHKDKGVTCGNCSDYDSATPRLLILKTGALGDVLRTTALLPPVKARFPRAHVTWVTRENAFPLFVGLSEVDRLLPYSWETYLRLRQERFDRLWSLDFDPAVAAWATELRAAEKRGFGYSDGELTALNEEARSWVHMSLHDGVKRENTRTYQDWLLTACGLSGAEGAEPRLVLTETEREWARKKFGPRLSSGERRIGVNTGAGGRWAQKKWTRDGIASLLARLRKEPRCRVLLLGGPEETELNRGLAKQFPWCVDTGCSNTLREFAAIVDLCSVVVTGDTMAMHIAIALKKRVVAFFGPTSAAEIEMYGRGEKVHKDWDCLPCYRAECLRSPNCMEALTADDVLAAVRRQWAPASAPEPSPSKPRHRRRPLPASPRPDPRDR